MDDSPNGSVNGERNRAESQENRPTVARGAPQKVTWFERLLPL